MFPPLQEAAPATGVDPALAPPVEPDSVVEAVGEWLNRGLFNLGGESISALQLITAVIIVLLSFQLSRFMQRMIGRGLQRAGVESEGTLGTINRLLHYGIVVLGFLIALQQLNIRLEALLAAGAIFAVAVGFAMQNIVQNFVSGVILLLERSIKPGDVLEVEGLVVRVVDMGIRTTVARTRDEEEIIVPNSILVQNTVKNYTLRDSVYRLRCTVGVSYGSDMEHVEKTLNEAAQSLEWREKDRAPRVQLLTFGDSSVVWEVSVWIRNPWFAPRLRSRLNLGVWSALKEEGITIAFPQLDLHMKSDLTGALSRIGAHERGA